MACALLLGHTSYYEYQHPGLRVPKDDIYFVDLGKPLDACYRHDRDRKLAYRYFTSGFVVVNDGTEDLRFTVDMKRLPSAKRRVYDTFAGADVEGFLQTRKVSIPPSRYLATGRVRSSGRIFVYRDE